MAKRRLAVLFLAVSIAITLPLFAYGAGTNATGGLVPCGVSSSPDEATQCQACSLVQLAQNVIMFLIGLAIPIAVGMFAWAGILYFTSGAGGSENISKAKKIFSSSLLGFVVAISAWLIVNTLLNTIVNKDIFSEGSWFRIECSAYKRLTGGTIGGVLSNHLGAAPDVIPPTNYSNLKPVATCTQPGYTYVSQYAACMTPAGKIGEAPVYKIPAPLGSGTLTESRLTSALSGTYKYSAELATICAKEGLSNCKLAQAIMAIESNGNPTAGSGMGAVGLMQLMPGTARGLDQTRFAGKTDAQIASILKTDTTLNMTLGVRYLSSLSNAFGESSANTIAAYNGGPGANSTSTTCPGQTYWECTANAGYAETRNYVPNVLNAMSIIY